MWGCKVPRAAKGTIPRDRKPDRQEIGAKPASLVGRAFSSPFTEQEGCLTVEAEPKT